MAWKVFHNDEIAVEFSIVTVMLCTFFFFLSFCYLFYFIYFGWYFLVCSVSDLIRAFGRDCWTHHLSLGHFPVCFFFRLCLWFFVLFLDFKFFFCVLCSFLYCFFVFSFILNLSFCCFYRFKWWFSWYNRFIFTWIQ